MTLETPVSDLAWEEQQNRNQQLIANSCYMRNEVKSDVSPFSMDIEQTSELSDEHAHILNALGIEQLSADMRVYLFGPVAHGRSRKEQLLCVADLTLFNIHACYLRHGVADKDGKLLCAFGQLAFLDDIVSELLNSSFCLRA